MQTKRLNNGNEIPAVGFGTWKLSDGDEAKEAVSHAIEAGYRLFDTAAIYGNEGSVGRALASSGIAREEVFVATKLWKTDMGYDSAKIACNKSLDSLGLEYLDLYLIHWPSGEKWKESWSAMEEMHKAGQVKNIGVSNFGVDDLEQLDAIAHIQPAVNQIELHPFNYKRQKPILDYCQQHNIVVMAYSPLAQSALLSDKTLQRFADFYHKTPAQIMLRWSIQHGAVPIPRSRKQEHIVSNLNVFDFALSSAEMTALDNLNVELSVLN